MPHDRSSDAIEQRAHLTAAASYTFAVMGVTRARVIPCGPRMPQRKLEPHGSRAAFDKEQWSAKRTRLCWAWALGAVRAVGTAGVVAPLSNDAKALIRNVRARRPNVLRAI